MVMSLHSLGHCRKRLRGGGELNPVVCHSSQPAGCRSSLVLRTSKIIPRIALRLIQATVLSKRCFVPIARRWTSDNYASTFAFSKVSRCSMKSSAKPSEPPFAANARLAPVMCIEEDPYRALDDLMAVVEVLCPVWPPREGFVDGGKMLL